MVSLILFLALFVMLCIGELCTRIQDTLLWNLVIRLPLHSSGFRHPDGWFEGRRRASLSHEKWLTVLLTLCWIWLVIWLSNDRFLHMALGPLNETRKAEMSSQHVRRIAVRFERKKTNAALHSSLFLCWEKKTWLLTLCKRLFVLNLGTHFVWRIYRCLDILLSPRWPAWSSIPAFILALLKRFLMLFQLPLLLRFWHRYKPNIFQRCHQNPISYHQPCSIHSFL